MTQGIGLSIEELGAYQGARALSELLLGSSLLVAVGSGGVGKTTSAAALAIAAARQGRRCALLTIDPAKRLAQALGLEGLGNDPRPLDASLVGPGSVDAMMLEAGDTFDDLIARLVPDPARRERLLQNRLYLALSRSLGGTHEYMAVERLYALMHEQKYDLVVLDTPPTVNALDFMDAPSRISSFFSDRIARFFVRDAPSKGGLFSRMKDRAGEMALGVMGKTLGQGFVDELRDFATAFQGLFEAFRERGDAVQAILADLGTSFIVVTGPDSLRVSEALAFADALQRHDVVPSAFIANRVHLFQGEHVDVTAADLFDAGVLGEKASAAVAALERAQQRAAAVARRDRAGLRDLEARVGSEALLVVPELDDEVKDRAAVEHLVGFLTGQRAASDVFRA